MGSSTQPAGSPRTRSEKIWDDHIVVKGEDGSLDLLTLISTSCTRSPASNSPVAVAVMELDYRPNAHAKALRSTRSDSIGLLVPDVRNPFFADLGHTIERGIPMLFVDCTLDSWVVSVAKSDVGDFVK